MLSLHENSTETFTGLSHCMKAVDFIIELADLLPIFIEFKDAQASTGSQASHGLTYLNRFLKGQRG